MKHSKIHDATMLSRKHVYDIGGTLYRYLWEEPNKRGEPQYHFRPHGNQRKKTDVILNERKLLLRVHQIEGMTINGKHDEMIGGNVQLSLF